MDKILSPLELAMKAGRSRHPYIRKMGDALAGRCKWEDVPPQPKVGLMPAQLELISQINRIREGDK